MVESILNKNIEVELFECGKLYDDCIKISIEYLFENKGIKKIIIE